MLRYDTWGSKLVSKAMKGKNEGTKLKALGLVMRVLAVGIWDNLVFFAYNYTIIKLCQKCKIY